MAVNCPARNKKGERCCKPKGHMPPHAIPVLSWDEWEDDVEYVPVTGVDYANSPNIDPPQQALTIPEHQLISMCGDIMNLAKEVFAHGPTRSLDLNEMAFFVHGIQNMVLAQAGARAYPDLYRLLGSVVQDDRKRS